MQMMLSMLPSCLLSVCLPASLSVTLPRPYHGSKKTTSLPLYVDKYLCVLVCLYLCLSLPVCVSFAVSLCLHVCVCDCVRVPSVSVHLCVCSSVCLTIHLRL